MGVEGSAGGVRAQVVLLLHSLVGHVHAVLDRPHWQRLVAHPLHEQLRLVGKGDDGRGLASGVLVEHADRAVLTDPVRHLGRVDPHGELGGEQAVQVRAWQPDGVPGLGDDGVHGAVDSQAPVGGASVRPVGEPVVAVPVGQQLAERALEHLELGFAQAVVVQPEQLHQEVDSGMDFEPHVAGLMHIHTKSLDG